MKPLRLALISRRFWPQVGGAETATADLAGELQRLGHAVQIVTAQSESHRPLEISHREVPVVRLPHPGRGFWGRLRYMYALMHWLDRRKHELDAVIVSSLRDDAWCATRTLAGAVPVIARIDNSGPGGDCAWQRTAWWGGAIRRACQAADAFVAADEAAAADARAAEYAPERIRVIPPGVRLRPPRSAEAKQAARNALRGANPDLTLDDRAPLVVYLGPFVEHKNLAELIRAWALIADRRPLARLWLVGDGPLREKLWELICDLDQKYRICMPGTFDDVDEVLAAADVVVSPAYESGLSLSLLEAMAAGVPVVATDHDVHRAAISSAGALFDGDNPTAIAKALESLLEDEDGRRSCGVAGLRLIETRYNLTEHATAFVQLIEELRGNRSATSRQP